MNAPHVGYSHCLLGMKTYLCVCEEPIWLRKQVIYNLVDIYALQKHVHIFLGLLGFNKRLELVGALILQDIINTENLNNE